MKKYILLLACIIMILTFMTGCEQGEYYGEFKDDDEVAMYVNTLLNEQYGEYFDGLHLFCCDYGTDQGLFYATVYAGSDTGPEFGAEYDIRKELLTTDASLGYHESRMRKEVKKIINDAMRSDPPMDYFYDFDCFCKYTPSFILDYATFIADYGTTLELNLYFEKPITDEEAKKIQNLMAELDAHHFNGTLCSSVDERYSKELDLHKKYTLEEIKKCDEI